MDGDELTGHRVTVLHAGESDVSVTDLEVLTKVSDHLGVRHPFLLQEEVEMVSTTTRLIERKFLDEEVFIPKLDATTQIRI